MTDIQSKRISIRAFAPVVNLILSSRSNNIQQKSFALEKFFTRSAQTCQELSSDCDGKYSYAYEFVIEENLEDTKDIECAVVVFDDMLDIVKKYLIHSLLVVIMKILKLIAYNHYSLMSLRDQRK